MTMVPDDVDYALHDRLAADTVHLGRSRLCDIQLMNDRQWPWVLLVPRVAGIREVYELSRKRQARLAEESSILGEGMMRTFSGDKLNVAALGNMVPQLHVHHIVRFEGDPAWPGPVWGKLPPQPYSNDELLAVRHRLQAVLDALT